MGRELLWISIGVILPVALAVVIIREFLSRRRDRVGLL
jgi:hypothetical protein